MMPKGRKTLPLKYHNILKSAAKRFFGKINENKVFLKSVFLKPYNCNHIQTQSRQAKPSRVFRRRGNAKLRSCMD